MTDVFEIKANDTAALDVVNPETGEKIGLTLHLVYPRHPRITAAEKVHGKRVQKRNGDRDVDAAMTMERHMAAAAVESMSFEGKTTWKGEQKSAVDRAELAEDFADPRRYWLVKQILEKYGDESDFFQKAPGGSKRSAKP
ncbi:MULTISPECIES: hypothetical protein [Hyphobacterium]|uniref:Uncharacterized protein n=1 Tax=Hyphobacterium vulgare TaxID=1736751 RepID=A0ABV6ZU58_9PROT